MVCPYIEQARIGCLGLYFASCLAILPFSVMQIIMSTSFSASKATAQAVVVSTSKFSA